jgi:hypothetical protein
MALKDLKSDLSKFRRPVENPLVEKPRVNIPKSSNQTPLSQFVGNTPDAPKSQTTTPKQGVTPTKFDNSPNFLGETSPSQFDNSSNYLGETTTKRMSLEERFLGQTETTQIQQGDKFKGETETANITQGDRFKGQTTPQDYSNAEKFKGETTPAELKFTQQFLGETTPKPSNLSEKFLGETNPSKMNLEARFLGETDMPDMVLESPFKGETTPTKMNLEAGFLGETTPSNFTFDPNLQTQAKDPQFADFIANDDAKGFSPFLKAKSNSTFVGVDPSQTKFDGVTPISGQFVLNQYGVDIQNDSGLGKTYTNEVLKQTYNKFNLKEDSHNSSIFKQPFILSGIQRKKGEPQTLGFGSFSFIRGGAITSTARALIDAVRVGQFLLTPRGLIWSLKQIGMQRSQTYGKQWTPINLLSNIATQHLGLRFDRPGVKPIGDESWKYNPGASINISPLLSTYNTFTLGGIGIESDVWAFKAQIGGPDSFYGIGASAHTRTINTFTNYKSDSVLPLPTIKDYEGISYGTILKIANGNAPSKYKGDFRNLKDTSIQKSDYTQTNRNKTYGLPETFRTNAERNSNRDLGVDKVYDSIFNTKLQNDFVHLFFAYDTSEGTQNSNKIIQFRATINGVTETFSPSWNGIKYPGRADKAYMYSEFERTLSFNFKAYANSRDEMENMWKKLSELSKLTMPTYGSAYSGHICYFRLGQLWGNGTAGVPSLITSLTYTIPDDLSWDLNHDGGLAELPMGVDVSVGLTLLPNTIYSSDKNHYSFYDTLT